MKIAKLRGPLCAVAVGAALGPVSSALADDGGRDYRPAPHHEATLDQRPYRAAPHHPLPGEATISYGQVAEPPAASSGGGLDWDDAAIGVGALAALMATAGVLARRRLTATRDAEVRTEGIPVSGR